MKQTDPLEIFNAKYRRKKITNLIISCITVLLGIFAIYYIFVFEDGGLKTFRWLTVDGTIFTTFLTAIVVVVNIVEFRKYTELTKTFVYLIRLSSAVTEGIIFIVVMISQLPCFEDHMHLVRPDMLIMHVIIPILTVISFIYNDSPIGKFRLRWVFAGNAYALTYTVVVITLIATKVITQDKIPYFFLDIRQTGVPTVLLCASAIFCIGMGLCYALVELNRRMYWRTLSIRDSK